MARLGRGTTSPGGGWGPGGPPGSGVGGRMANDPPFFRPQSVTAAIKDSFSHLPGGARDGPGPRRVPAGAWHGLPSVPCAAKKVAVTFTTNCGGIVTTALTPASNPRPAGRSRASLMLSALPFAIIAAIGVARVVTGAGPGMMPLLAPGPARAAPPPPPPSTPPP